MGFLESLFGNRHEREARKVMPLVEETNRVYETLHELSDDELRGKTQEFRARIADEMKDFDRYEGIEKNDPEGEKKATKAEVEKMDGVLNEILPEAFAVVKETCRRLTERKHTFTAADTELVWDMVPYDVQIIGGIMLHRGKIAEMATGEGKTLVATMPMYLNALAGRGAHLVTVNDYLARRDAEWMGQIYQFLGLSVGVILSQLPPHVRKEQYAADITYGTNNEFGFDYLRDNMSVEVDHLVQRGHHFAIVDEVDSVLIDEARTPLIIAGPVPRSSEGDFVQWNPSVRKLVQRQRESIATLIGEAENLLKEVEENSDREKEFRAGVLLYQANRAAPKHKRVMKALNEQGRKTLVQSIEDRFIQEKRQHELDEDLYFVIDEKGHTIDLTDKGREELARIEGVGMDMFILPDLADLFVEIDADPSLTETQKAEKKAEAEEDLAQRSGIIHTINQLLRAWSLYEKDDEYVIEGGKVQIVDEFTGRIMYGRRYSDGLHQAIEAKEGVQVEAETQTIATITLQNYFRLYGKLAGMTGTAETEEDEFFKIYEMEVAVIPTNQPIARLDLEDEIYRTKREKYNAIIEEIVRLHELGLPILVGTTSVDVSELIARTLSARSVNGIKLKDKINVLNAKQHQREAEIVAQAGRPGAITIATNMAGRGTDIKISQEIRDAHGEEGIITARLAADPGLRERHIEQFGIDPADPKQQTGGLQIVGTERHEARRIDRQLRGRSGRQGDPGQSKFYLSLEDDLMRLFSGDRVSRIMDRLGLQDGEVITHRMVTNAIGRAQKRVEQHNFSIREHLLKYDDVMNVQREVVYSRRRAALTGDIDEEVSALLSEFVAVTVDNYCPDRTSPLDWDWEGLRSTVLRTLRVDVHFNNDEIETLDLATVEDQILDNAREALARRKVELGDEIYDKVLRYSVLRVVDQQWMDHLYEMDRLKEGIGLRSYAQRDPLIEYKREGLEAFEEMLARIAEQSLRMVMTAQINLAAQAGPIARGQEIKRDAAEAGRVQAPSGAVDRALGDVKPQQRREAVAGAAQPVMRDQPKVGRNDPCPCGSGKKYKHCHGRNL